MKIDQKKLEKSQIEITVKLTEEEFKKHIDRALLHLKSHVKIDGFRPGQVPLDMVEKKMGQENLLMEAGDLAVKESYTKYVNENNLEPIGSPEVQILKIPARHNASTLGGAKGKPDQNPSGNEAGENFVFKIKFSVLPEIQLPDYKDIASKIKMGNISIDEKEIEDALQYLQKSRAKFTDKETAEKGDYVKIEYQNENINSGKPVKDMFILGESGFLPDFESNVIGMKKGDKKEFSAKFPSSSQVFNGKSWEDKNAPDGMAGKEGKFNLTMLAVQTMELPEINDEFAKSLGVFDSLVALKSNLKEGINMEKKEGEKQRRRAEILERIAEAVFESKAPIFSKIGARPSTKISENFSAMVPEKMVELEKERLLDDLKNQVANQFKIPFEEYLKTVKKGEEDLKKSYRAEAERRIKNYLVLRQIGRLENIEISKEEIEEEMNKFIRSYTKEEAEKIDINQLKEYTKSAIQNEKIFQFLEKLSH